MFKKRGSAPGIAQKNKTANAFIKAVVAGSLIIGAAGLGYTQDKEEMATQNSQNWAGVAALSDKADFYGVRATWLIPDCTFDEKTKDLTQSMSVFIGLGGAAKIGGELNDSRLIQIGITRDNFMKVWVPFYEMLPDSPMTKFYWLEPGQKVAAEITESNDKDGWHLDLYLDGSKLLSVDTTYDSKLLNSAEFIVERNTLVQTSGNSIFALPDCKEVEFVSWEVLTHAKNIEYNKFVIRDQISSKVLVNPYLEKNKIKLEWLRK